MKLSEGVEWSIHMCSLLAGTGMKRVSVDQLAGFYDLPKPYLAKQLQALANAGIVDGSKGRGGGYRLARAPAEISLLDIVLAIEGAERAFRCSEIRQCGPAAKPSGHYKTPCTIASAMWNAEAVWRAELKKTSIAQIVTSTLPELDSGHHQIFADWFQLGS
jgi:Rrf2 family protein